MPLPLLPAARAPRLLCLLGAAAALAEAIALGLRLTGASAPYDDAWITFRYARNWAEGAGFVYNAGEAHLGTTAPFFALTLGLAQVVAGVEPPSAANWISALAMGAAAWFVLRLVVEDYGVAAGAVAGLSTALNPMLLSTWGGEWLPAAALMAVAAWGLRAGRPMLLAAAGSIAILLRAEAAIGVGLFLAYAVATKRDGAWRAVGVSAAIGLAWVVVAWLVIGQVLPGTLEAKIAQGRSGLFGSLAGGFVDVVKQFVRADARMIALALLAWHGLLMMTLKPGVWRLLPLWAGLHLAFYTALGLPFYHWYLEPIALVISIAAGAGVVAIQLYAKALVRPPRAAGAVAALLVVAIAGPALLAEAASSRHWIRLKPDPREAIYDEAGAWLAAHTPGDATVAYLEIGRIGYGSRRRIVDPMGLVTPGALEGVRRQDPDRVIHLANPDYYLHHSAFSWASRLPGQPWFGDVFERVASFAQRDGGGVLTIYRRREGARLPPPLEVEPLVTRGAAIVGEIVPGASAGQTFLASRDGLAQVELRLATYARVNQGRYAFSLHDAEGVVVHEETIDAGAIADNAWQPLRFTPVEDSRGRVFRIELRAIDAASGRAITAWYQPGDPYPGGTRLAGGRQAPGDLAIRVGYDDR